jgi:hypothetical protein
MEFVSVHYRTSFGLCVIGARMEYLPHIYLSRCCRKSLQYRRCLKVGHRAQTYKRGFVLTSSPLQLLLQAADFFKIIQYFDEDAIAFFDPNFWGK